MTLAVLAKSRGMTVLTTTRKPEKSASLERVGVDHVLIRDDRTRRQGNPACRG
jgi:NADPH:quinone reductase